MLAFYITVILSVVFVLWLWCKPRHKSPPMFPGALPLLGHICQVPTDPIDFWKWEKKVYEFALNFDGVILCKFLTHHCYDSTRDQKAGLFVAQRIGIAIQRGNAASLLGTFPAIDKDDDEFFDAFITDPNDALLVANTCLDKPYIYSFAKEMYKKGLITTDVSSWKPHRKLLNPAFNQQVMNSFLDVFNDQARALVTELSAEVGKDTFDMDFYLRNSLLKTACQTTLGLNTNEDNTLINNYVLATKDLVENYRDRILKFYLCVQFTFNLSSLKKPHDMLVKTLKGISTEVIRRKLESKQITKNGLGDDTVPDKFQPLLDRMLYLAETQDSFTLDEIQDHVNTTIAAATDSTAQSIRFTLILIGSHKDVQSRIIQELNEVFEGEDRNVTKSDLQKLVYLEAVIKESMRLYPAAPRFLRHINTNVKLRQYTLLAGSTCVISVYGINRHPMWGADADQFRPERWLDPASLPDNPNAFATFSLGKRNCIGKLYAMMVTKTTLVYILRHYHITSSSHDLQTRCDIVQSPVEGHKITIQHRS